MKIIAIHKGEYDGWPEGAIVEMSQNELRILIGGSQYPARIKEWRPGKVIEISQPFIHAQNAIAAANSALKLPNALRAFADTLETLHPTIDGIINPVIDAEFEVIK